MNRNQPLSSDVHRPSWRQRGRLWLLVLLLAGVLWMMKRLDEPDAVQRLGRLFLLSDSTAAAEPDADADVVSPNSAASPAAASEKTLGNAGAAEQTVGAAAARSAAAASLGSKTQDAWAEVRDNSVFLSAEQPAWLALLDEMRQTAPAALADSSLGEVTYAQLRSQPDDYRGRIVTVRGTALQVKRTKPAANDLGIESYYRVVLAPRGGGQWPLVAYCLRLPERFPRGDDLRESVVVLGAFLKNWSYSYGEGFGLAPVIVAPTLDWRPHPPATSAAPSIDMRSLLLATGGSAAAAAVVVGLIYWQTSRKPKRAAATTETLARLDALESTEHDVAATLQELARREER